MSAPLLVRRLVRTLRRQRRSAGRRWRELRNPAMTGWTALTRSHREDHLHRVRWHTDRLEAGWTKTSLVALHTIAQDATEPAYIRKVAQEAVDAHGKALKRATRTAHYSVVIMSNFSLPGGTNASNAEEIVAHHHSGLTTGLVHQPVYEWDVTRPLNPRIASLVADGYAELITEATDVTCDVLIIRGPQSGPNLRDNLPAIHAKRTVAIINQTPARYYNADGPQSTVYSLSAANDNYVERFGPVTWHPIGPRVRELLHRHHSEDLSALEIAPDDWCNIVDAVAFEDVAVSRSAPRDKMVIGRHSRDDIAKWPENRQSFLDAYPDRPDVAVRVLGGAQAITDVYGPLPTTWEILPFNSIPVSQFLSEIDVYVYFTASHLAEAFGRAPLEAMAAGLPTILPPVFASTFKDGAIYAEPHQVSEILDSLRDPRTYTDWAHRAREVVLAEFSHARHIRRLEGEAS